MVDFYSCMHAVSKTAITSGLESDNRPNTSFSSSCHLYRIVAQSWHGPMCAASMRGRLCAFEPVVLAPDISVHVSSHSSHRRDISFPAK